MEMTGFSVYWDQITQAEMWGDLLLSHFVGNVKFNLFEFIIYNVCDYNIFIT